MYVCSSRWVDQNSNLPVVPSPSPASSGVAFLDRGGVSPACANAPEQPWGSTVYGNTSASSVHSPGWPSPRGVGGGFMPLPSPNVRINGYPGAEGGAFAAMPPTPPHMLSTPGGGGGDGISGAGGSGAGGGGLHPQSIAKGEAVGVAWLGPETTPSTGPAGAAAVAGAGDQRQAVSSPGTCPRCND